MPFFTHHKKIAVKPFGTRELKTTIKGALALTNYHDLIDTEVVFAGDHPFAIGTKLWLRNDAIKHQWASEIFKHGEIAFCVMPLDLVLGYEANYEVNWAPIPASPWNQPIITANEPIKVK